MNLAARTMLFVERFRQFIASVPEIMPQARIASRKPTAIGYILRTAHRAQIALGIPLLLLVLLAPTAVDFFTNTVFPPETSNKVFGLLKTQHANPLKSVADAAIMTVLWPAAMALHYCSCGSTYLVA
jgi:hypothetical protein